METLETDSEHDYGDTSETTLSLYALEPAETNVDSEDLESFEELSNSVMEANSWEGCNYDYAYPRQSPRKRRAHYKNLFRSSGTHSIGDSSEYNNAVQSEIKDEEMRVETAMSCIDLETALSEISIYSQYTPAPSETNVEIEYDIIAKASPMSTAVSGNVSWYSLPKTGEIEMQPSLYMEGAGEVDSIESFNILAGAEVIAVKDLDNLGPCAVKTCDAGEKMYEYSCPSNDPSETDVEMNRMHIFVDNDESDYKAASQIPDIDSLRVETCILFFRDLFLKEQ
ncbi:hypothetical protein RB195_013420 [Necator americanus]|uniref:Uncharacterized protein n=1 Tax=Necator americanus TaxID=51031 RepID=A0ABR1DVD6_NECAM